MLAPRTFVARPPWHGFRSFAPLLTGAIPLLAVILYSSSAAAFGGESLPDGPFHHEHITKEAADEAGFTRSAAAEMAWHADWVDSYLYNPLWWIDGGLDRYKVSLASYDQLAKVHFDDLPSADRVRFQWQQYLTGTIAGLLWAAEREDVSAARHITGISLHAIQDFYSHSSWVNDPAFRNKTWFEVPPAERDLLSVWTGAYEQPAQLGVKHHGKIMPECTLFNQAPVGEAMEVACAPISPLSKTGMCQTWKACQDGRALRGAKVFGVTIPKGFMYVAPPGINLDNTWQAEIGVRQRGLTGVTGREMFDTARELAKRSSMQWLQTIEGTMDRLGEGAFWDRVKTEAPAGNKEREYENYGRFPYQFLTAGPYPPDPRTRAGEEYYLRVQLKTSGASGAGTDADIYLRAGGHSFLLDNLPRTGPLIAYNDFEAGDNQVYTVGPFSTLPATIVLENRAADAGDVLSALGRDFVNAVGGVIEDAGDFLLSLIGGHADHVKSNKLVWSSADLAAVGTAEQAFSIRLDGKGEGDYRVRGTIRKVSESTGTSPTQAWADYSVRLIKLECINESKSDRGTNSDEPFVLALLIPLPGDLQKHRTRAYEDVDSGEDRGIDHTFARVRVPKQWGMLSLALSQFESDDEGGDARDQLLREFAKRATGKTQSGRWGFTDALGAALAADWKLARINVYAFSRGDRVHCGTVLDQDANRWIEGGERATFTLNAAGVRDAGVTGEGLQARSLPLLRAVQRPVRRPQMVLRPQGLIASQTVTVSVLRARAIDPLDEEGDAADFYGRVVIAGEEERSEPSGGQDDLRPEWQFSREVTSATVPITIGLFDEDSGAKSDTECDINPRSGARSLALTYDLRTGRLSGDLNGLRGQQLHVRGDGDSCRAEIRLSVDHR